jgi:hypothetical protein
MGRDLVTFGLADHADDADIRSLLRRNPMPGQISITLEREPNYFLDENLFGTNKQSILVRKNGRAVCTGSCTIRERFVNGEPRRVGYLGGLRLDSCVSGRFDILRKGYTYFQKLQASNPADYYFTSISSDNKPARDFLEKGLPGMPTYDFLDELVTVLLPAKSKLPVILLEPCCADISSLMAYINKDGKDYQFAPCWSQTELSQLHSMNLKICDFKVLKRHDNINAIAGLWDQRLFRQTVIRRYSGSWAFARSLVNFASHIFNTPSFPNVGSVLSQAILSPFAVPQSNAELLYKIIIELQALAAERCIEFLTLALAAKDPRLVQLRKKFHFREYYSRIYLVYWPGLGGSSKELDERLLGPDLALL